MSQLSASSSFSQILKRERSRRGWTQSYLAGQLGVTANTISRWERGEHAPNEGSIIQKLGEIFGMTPEELGLVDRKPAVFLIYDPADALLFDRLKQDLQRHGITVCGTRERGPNSNAISRKEELQKDLQEVRAIILIASPHAQSSCSVREELEMAAMYQCPAYVFWAAGACWKEAVPTNQDVVRPVDTIDARGERYEAAVKDLVTILEEGYAGRNAIEPRNPYKGLRAFGRQDAHDFFGREWLIDKLADELEKILAQAEQETAVARMLAIIGPSGSGKSSVVMAGLLPYLYIGGLAGSHDWVYLRPMVPGERPLEALAAVLGPHFPERSLTSIREDLANERGLHTLALQLHLTKGCPTKVMLVVDQFEKLFTQTTDEQERKQFLHLLLTACLEPAGPVIVVLTLRADFFDRPMHYPELRTIIEKQTTLVFPMSTRDMQAVIERPAALPDVQLSFDENLVRDLLLEVQGQSGGLPLLEFTLDQLFRHRQGRQLTCQAYEAIGGVKGALAKYAEETYTMLPSDEHRRLVRTLFLRLVDPGETGQDTTRRLAWTELCPATASEAQLMQQVLAAFIAARLLTSDEQPGFPPTIEVSHEALLREWSRLADWLRTSRNDIVLQKAISVDAAAWMRSGRSADRLYRGSQLLEAEAWAKRNVPSRDEAAFLQAGIEERDHQEAMERARQARELQLQRQATRRQRYMIGLMGVISAVLVIGLIVTQVLYGQLQGKNKELQEANYHLQRSLPVSVTNLNDHGPGSLREAIKSAKPGGTITFAKSLRGKIVLTSGELVIDKDLTISGPGASILAISGGKKSRVFHISSGSAVVNISHLTIEDGAAFCQQDGAPGCWGGGIYNSGTLIITESFIARNTARSSGGGIANLGTLTLSYSTVSGNAANGYGGGIANTNGGLLTLSYSTVSNNTASAYGGGLYIYGQAEIFNSTISNNRAVSDGGGMVNQYFLYLYDSTISGNTADQSGGGIANEDAGYGASTIIFYTTIYENTAKIGGGIVNEHGVVSIETSIVAGDHADRSPDISGTAVLYEVNLIQNASGTKLTFGSDPNDPTVNQLARHSIIGKAPDLGPLANNGGPTQTHALLAGSPAIDQIPVGNQACTSYYQDAPLTDQRGAPRPYGSGCDLGAYEYGSMPPGSP